MCENCGAHSEQSSEGKEKQKKGLGVSITYCIE